jgi:WD40 repeat protein
MCYNLCKRSATCFGSGKDVKLFRLKESNDIKILRFKDKHPISSIALSNDIWSIAIRHGSNIIIRLFAHSNIVRCLAFTSNGHNLISISDDRTLRIWSLPNRIEYKQIEVKSDIIKSIEITYDGRFVM